MYLCLSSYEVDIWRRGCSSPSVQIIFLFLHGPLLRTILVGWGSTLFMAAGEGHSSSLPLLHSPGVSTWPRPTNWNAPNWTLNFEQVKTRPRESLWYNHCTCSPWGAGGYASREILNSRLLWCDWCSLRVTSAACSYFLASLGWVIQYSSMDTKPGGWRFDGEQDIRVVSEYFPRK